MDTEQIKILLERYNQGNCSPEEAAIVDQWFENINRHQSTYAEDAALDRELDSIRANLNAHIAPAPKVRSIYARYWYAAAAAVVLLAAGLFWWNQSAPDKHPAAAAPIAANQSNRIVKDGFIEITTPKAHKESITLEDGSTIELNAGSKVRYPLHFGENSRSISLEEGEAFFTVAADPARKFSVNTGELTTTALGTSFNIRAYAREHKVIVALVTGKVKVDQLNQSSQSAPSQILLPGEQLSYDRVSLSPVKTAFSKAEEVNGWKQGYLIFKDAPYNEIVTGIENRYGVTVINESDKTAWNYNGSFKNESLKDVMDIICLAKSLSYTIKKDTVYLQNKN
ncbi:FecR family protein [Chitinophaga arvensicola]|uniref:Ferric-dicitrate binding protein FerR, regulates iron transport through sigma-19 n=1 Tax=Chitinophaga arvensicola TaxID=29529 RepID=A0A1I0SC87_9BACT|nr:FecR family protein [Chitinophaga arvensicola]SEW54792.1 ferric-dicitrate binding protein FerR, regulates iron transport through sigma-19 [Chitinophaga arvensicola]